MHCFLPAVAPQTQHVSGQLSVSLAYAKRSSLQRAHWCRGLSGRAHHTPACHLPKRSLPRRINQSNSAGEQLKEAQAINKSLSALGDVISALTSEVMHIP